MLIYRPSRYLLEHGLRADGRIDEERIQDLSEGGSYETFFTETSSGKYVPRSIFVDLDPSVRFLYNRGSAKDSKLMITAH